VCGGILGLAMSDSPATPAVETVEPETVSTPAEKTTMDIVEIMAILPHRYPFLMIDRVIEMERKTRIVAIKNVTINEPHFAGHFPDYPIMPGVLTIEAMAQAGGALLLTEIPDRGDKLMVFTGIEEARFRRPIVPGDQLRIEVTVVNWRSRVVKMKGVCTVGGKIAADAIITCQLVPRVRKPKVEDATGEGAAAE
jgi:3-hydroxyacyl-[acyl-carrier-protein] dehydratase